AVACAVTVLAGCAGHARVDITQAQPQEQEENVVQETRPADHDFQSAQKEVQITLPDDWRVQPNPNTPSLLHVAAPDQSKSINISRTRRSDMISKSTLTDYMTLHKKGVNAIVDSNGAGEKVLRTDSISIDQYSAYLKETEVDYGKNHFG
ncbi:hypothetical protein BZG21_32410, partial [Escherichia coli]|nr:hypothetical protein [Escherichia coli]